MWPFSHQNSTVVFSNSSKIRHWRKLALTKVKCYWTTIFNWSFFGGWKTLKIYNGRTLIQLPSQALLQTDNSLTGWGWGGGAVWEGMKTGGTWTQQEIRMHKNELERFALKLSLETFLKAQEIKSLHVKMDNIVALTYLLKMGGAKNLQMVCLSRQIWEMLLRKKVTVTAEYLPSRLSKHADIETRH